MVKKHFVKDLPGLAPVAAALLESNPAGRVFVFHGAMGAGKTTFIKAICGHLGVTENTASPTYSLVNEYAGRGRQRIFHFDFYRIRNISEAYDIGFEEYLDSGAYCLIEWPEKVAGLLPESCIPVIVESDGDSRIFSFPVSA